MHKLTNGLLIFLALVPLLSCTGHLPLAGRSVQEAFNYDEGVVNLLKAVNKHDTNEAKRLIEGGVDVNTFGKDGATPLIWMLVRKNLQAMEVLLKLGANPNQYEPNGVGTPVWLSAAGGKLQSLQLLLDHGADPNLIYGGKSPLMMAISGSHLDCAELLLQRGADINYGGDGLSAMDMAMLHVQFGDALWLLDHGYTYELKQARRMLMVNTPRSGQEHLKVKALEIIDRLIMNM